VNRNSCGVSWAHTGHNHEGHDDLGDHVEDGVGAHLERDREGGEALGEEPHNGVADPGKDREPGKLAVKLRDLTTLSVSVGLEDLREVHDHGEQAREADKEPEPLDGGNNRDGTYVAGGDVDGCSEAIFVRYLLLSLYCAPFTWTHDPDKPDTTSCQVANSA
jgi:hypothetical protein